MPGYSYPVDPIINYTFICPKCMQVRSLIRTVNEEEMICSVCGYHLRRGNIHHRLNKRPKYFFLNLMKR